MSMLLTVGVYSGNGKGQPFGMPLDQLLTVT